MDAIIKEILLVTFGSGGMVALLALVIRVGRIVEKIDNLSIKSDVLSVKMERDMNALRDKMDKNIGDLRDIQENTNAILNGMAVQMGRLETRVEERTLRVIHVEKDVAAH